jgi:hypothetical protein
MANITINPSVETLSLVAHNQVPVVTTELLAQLYATDINNIQKNYVRNKERFVEGKHFFKVTGEELKSFVTDLKSVTNSPVEVSSKTRSLILWTERGAARHAKMLDTDQAWDVFEKLEDCYFTKKPQEQLALSNGQHYVVAKDGAVIYHKPLSDRMTKNYLTRHAMTQEQNNIALLNRDTTNKVMDYLAALRYEIKRLGGNLPTLPDFDKETIVRAVVTSMVDSSRMLLSFSTSTGQPCISFIPQDSMVINSENIVQAIGDSDRIPKRLLPDIAKAAVNRLSGN